MKLHFESGLPFVTATLTYNDATIQLETVLIDTGSASTIFKADKLEAINIFLEPQDTINRIKGIGGSEFVFSKNLTMLAIDNLNKNNFIIEIGAMDYGFNIDGIIGVDFLTAVQAVIDFKNMEIL